LSKGNTPGEMQLKLREYFSVGVRLVWFIEPATQTATVYTSRTKKTQLGPADVLQGGTVLPGFRLPLATLFARAGRQRKPRR
jgi:Uma2 family endonuclease